ncbi:MAG: extracellular solute-binding protein [Lachnospiraceae bacterium]|nr:extracellular solute-binding protein [Lachnospiraceae bacterium]
MKRWIIVCIALAVILYGCTVEKEASETEEQEKEPLTIWCYYETGNQRMAMDDLTRGFNESQQQYEVTWEYVPMSEFSKKLSMGYTENLLPDMVLIDNPDMPVGIKTGMFVEITDIAKELRIREDYYPSVLQTVYDGETCYGLPLNCNDLALIYNKEILEEEGVQPPKDWESFREAVKKLTREDKYGFLMCAMEGEQGAFQMLPWVLATGEQIEKIDGAGTEKAFQFLYELIESGGMDVNCINYSQNDVARKFVEGETAMMENGPWILPMLDEAGISYGIVPLPADVTQKSVIGGENIGILKGKNIEGAKAFIRYCGRDDVMYAFCKTAGVLSTKKSLARRMVKENEKMAVFQLQMEHAVSRRSNEHWKSLSQQLSKAIYRMMSEDVDAETLAKEIAGK